MQKQGSEMRSGPNELSKQRFPLAYRIFVSLSISLMQAARLRSTSTKLSIRKR